MTRRFALKTIAAFLIVTLSGFLTGCAVSVQSLAQAFLASADAIYAVDPTPELATAIAALKTAIANYNGSSTDCILISTAGTVATVIDEIDPNSAVAEVAAIAIAGFDALMAKLAPCTTPNAVVAHKSRIRGTAAYATAYAQFKHSMFPSHAYKSKFNAAAKTAGLKARI